MNKTILVLAIVATFIAGMSAIAIQDNMALAAKPVPQAPYVVTSSTIIEAGLPGGAYVYCHTGDKATGGGFASSTNYVQTTQNAPQPATGTQPNGWFAYAQNNGVSSATFDVYVVCQP